MSATPGLTILVRLVAIACCLGAGACTNAPPTVTPPPAPPPPPAYTALRDTTVCVVDRSTPLGLIELPAKVGPNGPVLVINEQIRPIAAVHPTNVIAGYAGQELWLRRSDPIIVTERRYVPYGSERRIAINMLARAAEHLGILLFAGLDDPAPFDVLYVPTAPGCVFQAYVREDLMQR